MILYLKDPEDSTKKLLDMMNTFGKVAVYKISKQKSVVFLQQTGKEIRKTHL
jgi:hypothetical protein